MKYIAFVTAIIGLSCLGNPQDDRFEQNQSIGKITHKRVDIHFKDGPIELRDGTLFVRSQTPNPQISFVSQSESAQQIDFLISNLPPSATASSGSLSASGTRGEYRYSLSVAPQQSLTVDLNTNTNASSYRVGVVGDIQNNTESGEKIARHAAGQNLDFFIVCGDFVQRPTVDQYEWAVRLSQEFETPVYVVYGNHEGFSGGYKRFRKFFGTTNLIYEYNGDVFLFLDSADQTIGKQVFNFAKESLAGNQRIKLVFLHVPPFDQFGVRNNSFNSRYEAARFQKLMIENGVNIVFSGHIHSFQDFHVGGVRNIVVGTGGGLPERLDGVDYRYVIVEVNKDENRVNVTNVDIQ